MASVERAQVLPAICGLLAGPVLLVGTVAGALAQPDEFSIVDHANSDLGAATADSPWLSNQLGSNLPGLLLLVFAIGLWRSLDRHRLVWFIWIAVLAIRMLRLAPGGGVGGPARSPGRSTNSASMMGR